MNRISNQPNSCARHEPRDRIMKRLYIAFFLLFAAVSLKAQVFLIDSFELTAAEGVFGIYADYDCTSNNEFYLDMQANNDAECVQMRLGKIDDFVSSFRDAQEVFEAWSKIAHDNGVTSVAKDIYAHFFNEDMYYTVGGIWFEKRSVRLKCKFLVSNDGTSYMVLQTDDMESENGVDLHSFSIDNSFHNLSGEWDRDTETFSSRSTGAFLAFTSEEIEMFISKLYEAKAWKSNNIEQGKLFK